MNKQQSNDLWRVDGVRGTPEGPVWSFSVPRGAACWLPVDAESPLPWMDWLTGLEEPSAGSIQWKGKTWASRSADDASVQRGRIGCLSGSSGLISNLDMDENVWLPARMHRQKDAAASIQKWAEFFGIWPLPPLRLPQMRERDRLRVLWTRLFAGEPEALLLDRPLGEVAAPEDRRVFLDAVVQLHATGIPVVWIAEQAAEDIRAALPDMQAVKPQDEKGIRNG